MTTRDLVPRQGQTYNRQNWAYKIRDLAAGASIGTGGIFATCNNRAAATFRGDSGSFILQILRYLPGRMR